MNEQQYMPIKPYFVLNKNEVAELQKEAGDLRKVVEAKDTPWVERTRAETRLRDVERQLQSARFAERLAERERPAHQVRADDEYAVSDDGTAYLNITALERVRRQQAAKRPGHVRRPRQFAEPVPYWK